MVKENNVTDNITLINQISTLMIRIGRRIIGTDKQKRELLNSALTLGNSALITASTSPKNSKKMFELMRRLSEIKD